jgi:hypothetical protein
VRIYQHTRLHAYPRTTTAWAELPSCVTPSLTYYPLGSRAHQPTNPKARKRLGRLASRASALAHTSGYGNINPLSIDYACRPRLRSRLTLGGTACPRNPWSSGGRDSHSPLATHACILTPTPSTTRSLGGFTGRRTLPYPPQHNAGMPRLRRCA